MNKIIAALVATLVISGAYAQTPVAAADASPHAMAAADSKRDMGNEKHIKELHAQLKITPDEEKLWAVVAATMRDSAKDLDKVIDKRKESMATATALDDLNAYADIAQAHLDSVKKFSSSFSPLYAAMSDEQKKLADEVFLQRGSKHRSAHAGTK
ncbi:MAG: Spy/CpxP family protein refolding chaperone [Burkholderiaceae bacterium]|nr:Spy/CpxP family protein refolding chaperone [Burkholderiaceae bacterium]